MSIDAFLIGLVSFCRSLIGIITRPYETYRRIIEKGSLFELVPIVLLLGSYFATASLVKTAAFRPYLLTKQFVVLSGSAAVSVILVVCTLYFFAHVVGGQGTIKKVFLGWAYTLIPTVVWFFMTSLLFVILPPPRTTHVTGVAFSICYIVISTVLLFWKIILSYLTLRFSMRLDLFKIILVVILSSPIIGVFSVAMYRLGIFKIPFL